MRNAQSEQESGSRRWRDGVQGRELVERYVESGLTQRVFAREEGIGVSTLHYWLRKVAAERDEEAVVGDGERPERKARPVSLVEVELEPRRSHPGNPRPGSVEPGAPAYELELPAGVRLRICAGFAEQEVRRLLAMVREEVIG